jgi:NAD-dependent deacetylase
MLICGTSAFVYPFADLPNIARFGTGRFGLSLSGKAERKATITIIEVNAEPTPLTGRISDYLIQGKTGEILPRIVEEVKRLTAD